MLPAHALGSVLSPRGPPWTPAEYALLPWMLAQGALCRLTYLIPEWHLSQQPPHARLAALGLRLSFHATLQSACRVPPRLIEHDEPVEMNSFFPVPGINDLAERFGAPGSMGRNPFKPSWHYRALLKTDARYLANTARAGSEDDACGRGRPRCAAVEHARAVVSLTGHQKVLEGSSRDSCRLEEMACSLNATTRMYEAMKCEPLVAGDTGPDWCAYGTPLQQRKSKREAQQSRI
jgi:hypothetical protein